MQIENGVMKHPTPGGAADIKVSRGRRNERLEGGVCWGTLKECGPPKGVAKAEAVPGWAKGLQRACKGVS
jgi:hypothetical protein